MSRRISITFPSLYQKQYEAIFCPKRYALIESGTKTGKTIGCSIWEASRAWEEDVPGDVSWWVAPTYAQAELGYTRMRALFPVEYCDANDSKLRLKLANGAVIECKSGEKPDNLFGAAVKRAVVDEASRLREESWHALRTTLTQTQGPVRLIGNPKGRKNWFWRWCQIAKQGADPQAAYFHLRSIDNPHISKEEIDRARSNMPKAVFEELYEGVAQEDGAGVFRNVRECATAVLRGPVVGRPYVAGLDLARLRDYSVLTVLDAITRETVHIDRFHELNWNLQVARFASTIKKYNNAQVMMDVTGLGDPIFDRLSLEGISIVPYHFSSESKSRLIEALSIAFERGAIRIPQDRELIEELEYFEYTMLDSGKVRYAAPEGMYDDMVVSLALANKLAEQCGYSEKKALPIEVDLARKYGPGVRPSGIEYWTAYSAQQLLKATRPSQGIEV